MGTTVNELAIKTALSTAEVREVLAQKGVKIQASSLFEIQSDGSVKIDIEGDGIYDKVITGLVSKDGNVNTKSKKIKVKDSNVSTSFVDKKNEEIKALKDKVDDLTKKSEAEFNKAKAETEAKASCGKKLADLNTAQQNAKTALENKQREDIGDMTKEEFKNYQKELKECKQKYQEAKAAFDKFNNEGAQKAYIEAQVKAAEEKHNKGVETAKEDLTKAQKEYNNAITSYNDFLKENGYNTKEERANVKAKKLDKKGTAFTEIKNKAAVIDQAVRKFISGKKQLADNVGTDYKIVIENDKVLIKAGVFDGDERADYTITGLFNSKTGELAVDDKNIGYYHNADSTYNVSYKVKQYKEALAKLNALNADINVSKNDKAYKEAAKNVETLKQELKAMQVSDEEMQQ